MYLNYQEPTNITICDIVVNKAAPLSIQFSLAKASPNWLNETKYYINVARQEYDKNKRYASISW